LSSSPRAFNEKQPQISYCDLELNEEMTVRLTKKADGNPCVRADKQLAPMDASNQLGELLSEETGKCD
jgi:hypothetical protein